jgi:hypothetical protein
VSTDCAEVLSAAPDRRAQHESGRLPAIARRQPIPDVKVLLISQRADGFFLERFNERGTFVGTTRRDEMDDAMREAYSEYGQISEWRFCPDDADPLEYIRGRSEF